MTVIPRNQFNQFFRNLTGEQQTTAQGMYDELGRDGRGDLRTSGIIESLDGLGGSTLDPPDATGQFTVRITITGVKGECLIYPDGVARSTLELQGLQQ